MNDLQITRYRFHLRLDGLRVSVMFPTVPFGAIVYDNVTRRIVSLELISGLKVG